MLECGHAPEQAPAPAPITCTRLMVVEGRTVKVFFEALLGHMQLLDRIQVRDFTSVTQLADALAALVVTPGFARVTSLGVVRDAESIGAEAAFRSACHALRTAGLATPTAPMAVAGADPKACVYILPDCQSEGMLESLCWRAVNQDPVARCVDAYLACVEKADPLRNRNRPKALMQAYLASRRKPGLLLGQAAHAGYLPWHSPQFDKLKTFLRLVAESGV